MRLVLVEYDELGTAEDWADVALPESVPNQVFHSPPEVVLGVDSEDSIQGQTK